MKEYPKPSVTVDTIIFAIKDHSLFVLLIERKHPPFEGHWAIPGGFVEMDETLGHAAARELAEETSLQDLPLIQFRSFGDPGRDPRGRTITVAYYVLLPALPVGVAAADDAANAQWFALNQLPTLAFDHQQVLSEAISDINARIALTKKTTDCFSKDITLNDLRQLKCI